MGFMRNLNMSLACCAALFTANAAQAAFPDRPVHLILGLAPGGGVDAVSRILGQALSEKWGQQVVVENRPGAGATIAADYVAHAAPDGYTILMATINLTVPIEGLKLDYDPVKSFSPVTLVSYSPDFLLASEQLPANTFKELVAYAKANPGKLTTGSTGAGTIQYLEMQHLKMAVGLNMVDVTYQGAAPTVVALMGNEIQLALQSAASSLEQVKAGKLKAITISGDTRSPAAPTVPTMAEAIAGDSALQDVYQSSTWYGILAPANTPKDTVTFLRDSIADVLKTPNVQKEMVDQGFVVVGSTPEEFTNVISDSLVRWTKAAAEAGPAK